MEQRELELREVCPLSRIHHFIATNYSVSEICCVIDDAMLNQCVLEQILRLLRPNEERLRDEKDVMNTVQASHPQSKTFFSREHQTNTPEHPLRPSS
jgi:hypothetical protein